MYDHKTYYETWAPPIGKNEVLIWWSPKSECMVWTALKKKWIRIPICGKKKIELIEWMSNGKLLCLLHNSFVICPSFGKGCMLLWWLSMHVLYFGYILDCCLIEILDWVINWVMDWLISWLNDWFNESLDRSDCWVLILGLIFFVLFHSAGFWYYVIYFDLFHSVGHTLEETGVEVNVIPVWH